jgi:hypothetical protein
MLIGGAAAGHGRVEEATFDLLAEVQSTVVLFEMNGIARSLYIDAVTDADLPDRRDLRDYLRLNQVRRGADARDPGRDPWGNPYEIYRGDQWFELVSAGPDKVPGTSDDLIVGREW